MDEIELPSGAKLKVTLSTFAESKDLYQAILSEGKDLKLDPDDEVDANLYKDLFCAALSSNKIEACIEVCMKRVTYNGVKIDKDTFEPEEARQDYIPVYMEVARLNVSPFTKSLFAQLKTIMAKVKESFQA